MEKRQPLKTYLTRQAGDLVIVFYVCPNLGECHVAYYEVA